jgi:pyruvate/2-oxoglutarate dehydrogenase complex dihydrolipoamide dehydrogenase (E3) component
LAPDTRAALLHRRRLHLLLAAGRRSATSGLGLDLAGVQRGERGESVTDAQRGAGHPAA